MKSIELGVSIEADAVEVCEALVAMKDNHLATMLLQLVEQIDVGDVVSVSRAHSSLVSPQEAADITQLSRTFICKLLDQGIIPEQPRVGTHRKILRSDLEEFMKNRSRASREFAKSMAHDGTAKAQLVRDIAGVSEAEASEFGY